MPKTKEEHVKYTRDEWLNNPLNYYKEIISYLKYKNILYILDIGANVGETANIFSEVFVNLKKSFLVEPNKENYNFILKNTKNSISEVFNCAIGYYEEKMCLIPCPYGNVGGWKIGSLKNHMEFNEVPVKELEELQIPIVDFVKMDVEGGEYNIIENSSYLKSVKFLEIEFHDMNINSKHFCEKHLQNHEIKIYQRYLETDNYNRVLLELK